MSRWVKRIGAAALTGLAVFGLDLSAAQAQIMPGGFNPFFRPAPGFAAPGFGARPMVQPQLSPAMNPFFAGAAGNLVANSAGGFPGYGGMPWGGGGYDGYGWGLGNTSGGALMGAASVMNAQGQFKVSRQQARLMAEQVRAAQLENKRRAFDEYMYEQKNTPSLEAIRQEAIQAQLNRSLNNPDPTEIASASALNNVLAALEGMPTARIDSPALTEDTLKRLNVVKGPGSSSLGLLRDEGKLVFPPAVKDLQPAEETAQMLKRLDTLARDAYAQASTGRVDADMLKKMAEISTTLNERLTKLVNDTPFPQYSDGKRFLRQLDDAIAVLSQPDAGEYLPNGKNAARGKNAADLVKYMAERGLRFAPATAGDEDAYKSVHRALANYHKALSAQLASSSSGSSTPEK
jgi:hypothetical protein